MDLQLRLSDKYLARSRHLHLFKQRNDLRVKSADRQGRDVNLLDGQKKTVDARRLLRLLDLHEGLDDRLAERRQVDPEVSVLKHLSFERHLQRKAGNRLLIQTR